MPVTMKQVESLHSLFCKIEESRERNRTYHIGAILSIVAMAIFSGHRNREHSAR